MAIPKLYEILNAFTESDWKNCKKYIRKNERKDSELKKLFNFLDDKKYDLPNTTKIHEKLFKKNERKTVLNKLTSLKSIIEDFLVINLHTVNKREYQYLLFKALQQKGVHSIASEYAKKLILDIKITSESEISVHLLNHKILHNTYFSSSKKKNNYGGQMLDNSINSLSNYLTLIKKQYKIEQYNRKLKSVVELQENIEPIKAEDLINIFNSLYQIIKGEENNEYKNLLNRIYKIEHANASETFVFILMQLIQVRLKLHNSISPSEQNDLLKLYILGLEHNAFHFNGYISVRTFGNIIDAGWAFKNKNWTKTVIEKYSSNINFKYRQETVNMAYAQLAILDKEYSEALNILNTLRLINIDHKLRMRWLKILCLFEQKQTEQLLYLLNSFTGFIRNNQDQFSEYLYIAIKNYISCVRKLSKGKRPSNEELNQPLVLKSWLIEKIKEVQN